MNKIKLSKSYNIHTLYKEKYLPRYVAYTFMYKAC